MLKCPRCGQRLQLAQTALTFRQRRILKAIEELQRDLGKHPAAVQIANRISVGRATVQNELAHLEHLKRVSRPNGKKSGWALHDDQDIQLIIAA